MREEEDRISRFFNGESKRMWKRQEEKGLPDSAIIQVNQICSNNSQCAMDVGSGPGSILISLLECGVNEVIGVDLSPEMTTLAQSRLSARKLGDQAEVQSGSFLDFSTDKSIDAISMHRVICCHPDRESMLARAIDMDPKIITFTFIRDRLIFKIPLALYSLIARFFKLFRPYIHSQRQIHEQLTDQGYEKIQENKSFGWVTLTYKKGE